jgi:hypothetical protein
MLKYDYPFHSQDLDVSEERFFQVALQAYGESKTRELRTTYESHHGNAREQRRFLSATSTMMIQSSVPGTSSSWRPTPVLFHDGAIGGGKGGRKGKGKGKGRR